ADFLREAECFHKELESGIRVLVEQIRHDARIPLRWVLRHGIASFRLARSKLFQERAEWVNSKSGRQAPGFLPRERDPDSRPCRRIGRGFGVKELLAQTAG